MKNKDRIQIGAQELKKVYNKNLIVGLFGAVIAHLILIGIVLINSKIGVAKSPKIEFPLSTTVIRLPFIEIPKTIKITNNNNAIKKQSQVFKSTNTNYSNNRRIINKINSTGNPIKNVNQIIDLNFINNDSLDNSSVNLNNSIESNIGGNSINDNKPNQNGKLINGNSYPSLIDISEDFIFVEKEVEFDYNEILKNIEYPQIAMNNGVQGKVTVLVYVNDEGKVTTTKVIESENKILEDVAISAIKKTNYKPAEQNGIKVGIWISIPIKFSLSR